MNTISTLSRVRLNTSYAVLLLLALLTCAWSQFCVAGPTNEVQIVGGDERTVGGGYANRYSVPSKDEAQARLKTFRKLGRAITLQEFLGSEIRYIRITFYDKPLDSFDRARAVMRELLASVVVSPDHRGAPMLEGPRWAELNQATIRALIVFTDGRIGRIHCDATDDGSIRAGGVHLFFEDHDGTFWWHRWDAEFPRKKPETP